jgi:epoxyqueuosine reductase
MTEKRIWFSKEPEEYIRRAVTRFTLENPSNRRKVDGGYYFDAPVVGFASADDPLFKQYKKIIGRFHLSPREAFDLSFGNKRGPKELSVISWIIPISEDARKVNRKEKKYPSLLWSHTRFFGEPFNVRLRNHVVSLLTQKGYRAVAPSNASYFKHHMHAPKVGFTSNWSERHAAYACGLGTFGLSDGFISLRGKAIRIGTVVTDVPLKPSEKSFPGHHANCLFTAFGACKACASRCPAGAISSKGHDKDKCFDYMHNVCITARGDQYGVKITGCGLCQTKVPCEFEIPKLIQKHRQ